MNTKTLICAFSIVLGTGLGGCATPGPSVAHDPWEGLNRSMYKFNDALDRGVLKPTATGYKAVIPGVVRTGVTNFFNNLNDMLVAINQLLQLKFLGAAQSGTRILFNSTVGIYGLIDVATFVGVPRGNEDFGQTMGFYGIPPGPYMVLPFFGPRTVRDSVGLIGDLNVDPIINIQDNTTYVAALLLRVVNTRANLLSASSVAETAALDPYVFLREAYLQQRENLVRDGRTVPGADDELDDLEELDELDDLDELDELDVLEESGELDELDELEQSDELDELDAPEESGGLDQLDGWQPSDTPDATDTHDKSQRSDALDDATAAGSIGADVRLMSRSGA